MDKDKSKTDCLENLDKNKYKEPARGGRKMATQLQPTPTLYGKDAEAVLEQIRKKPTKEQKRKVEERKAFFAAIKKKGLR